METIAVRPAVEADMGFIYSTWLKGQYFGNEFFASCDKDAYYNHYSKYVSSVLSLEGVSVLVACLADEPDIIVGYVVQSTWCIYWVYTKSAWRKKNVASRLVNDTITKVASSTKIGEAIRKQKGWRLNPWSGFEDK